MMINLNLKIGEYKQALEDFKKSVSLNTNFALGFNNVALCYQALGDIKHAIKFYDRASSLDSTMLEARVNLGSLYLDSNKFSEAIAAFNFALEINPLHEHTHQLIADAYIRIARFDLALSHHLKAKEINPSNYFNYYLLFKKPYQNWDNNLDVNLGFIQSTSLGGRKNDDRFDLLSKYGYQIDTSGMWFVSGLFNFRSQLFHGYSFSGTNKTLTSSFLTPAYIILSAGLDFKPSNKFSIFFSPLTSRTTLVLNNALSNLGKYGVTPGSKISRETGTFITINYSDNIATNVLYRGRADIFSNYNDKPENLNLYMTNYFSFKINKYFSATYNLDLIYDDKIRIFGPNKTSPGLQLKSIIGIGYQKTLQVKKTLIKTKL